MVFSFLAVTDFDLEVFFLKLWTIFMFFAESIKQWEHQYEHETFAF